MMANAWVNIGVVIRCLRGPENWFFRFGCDIIICEMKILAVADIHGKFDLVKLKGVDLLLLVGDIAAKRPRKDDVEEAAKMIKEWATKVPVVFVHGNHDSYKDGNKHWHNLEDLVDNFAENRFFCLNENMPVCEVDGLRIGGFPWFQCKVDERDEEKKNTKRESRYCGYSKKHRRELKGCDILMAHCPPADIGIDNEDAMKALNDSILRFNPRCFICGHAHCRAGVYNNNVYCVAGSPVVLKAEMGSDGVWDIHAI